MSILEQKRSLVASLPGEKSKAIAARRDKAVAKGVVSGVPVYAEAVDGAIIKDVDGNQFIDMGSGIAVTTVGASHPRVVEAVQRAVEKFTHTCFMATPYESYIALAEKVNSLIPGTFDKRTVFFNSGAEAVENAIKIARLYTGRDAIIAFEHAYHGRTNLTMALTAKAMPYKMNFGPFAPEIYRVPASYPFRDRPNHDGTPMTGEQAARRAITMIEKQVGVDSAAALIIEPIQGEGGFIEPALGFLPTLLKWAQENGIIFIADEVQTGLQRTGSWFACNQENIEPDLMTLAKGLAGGMPLAAVAGRVDLLDAVHPGGLGGTYGGNPVAVAAGLAALEVMEEEKLGEKAQAIEALVKSRMWKIQQDVPALGDIRGRGGMIAFEFVKTVNGLATKEPDADLTKEIQTRCLEEGVLVLACGTYGNVIRLLPPLVIGRELLNDALEVLERVIRDCAVRDRLVGI